MRPLHPASFAFLLAAGLAASSGSSFAGYGSLDRTFHGQGWSTFPAGGGGAEDMVLAGGRLVITGTSFTEQGLSRLAVWRLNPDGSRDNSFNGTGEFIFQSIVTEYNSQGNHAAVRPNGRIVVAGTAASRVDLEGGPLPENHIIQLLENGQLDPTFGTGGSGFRAGPGYFSPDPFLLSKDGMVWVGDLAYDLIRYNLNGTKDTEFPYAFSSDYNITGIAEQSNGRIICSLRSNDGVGAAALVRLHSDGALDISFGPTFGVPSGYVEIRSTPPGATIYLNKVQVLNDGKILAAGRYMSDSSEGLVVAKLLTDGTRDPSFGTGTFGPGLAVIPLGAEEKYFDVKSLNITGDGRILLTGNIWKTGQESDIAIVCVTPAGKLESHFGNGGIIHEDFGPYREQCQAVAMVSNDELLVGGGFMVGGEPTPHDLLLARYRVSPLLSAEYPAGQEIVAAPVRRLDFGPVTAEAKLLELVLKYRGPVPLNGFTATLSGETHPGDFSVGTFPSVLPNEGQVTVVVRLNPSGTGVRTATLTLAGTGPIAESMTIELSGARATPQEVWRTTWFGSPDNSGAGADLNDFDGDGLVNFMEYVTNSNPHQATASVCMVVNEGTGFTYPRPAAALSEFKYEPEAAADPAGPWSGEGLVSSVESENAGVQTVKVMPEGGAAGGRRFFRLRVTRL